jgi:hypothetical protein
MSDPSNNTFLFSAADIPTWQTLPSQADLTNEFKLDWVWATEYWEGRDLNDRSSPSLYPSFARMIEIIDRIAQAKRRDPYHGDYLSSREVFEFFDECKVRPATLKELLVFSKKYWQPKPNYPTDPFPNEKLLLSAHAPYVYALGTVFSDIDGNERVPYLYGRLNERGLEAGLFAYDWSESDRFLVFPKK